MSSKNENISATGFQSSKGSDDRRKRINRIKTIIVVIAILLLILPTIVCIILGIQVNRLQKQMEQLVSIHKEYGLKVDDEDYAYAAEISYNENDPGSDKESSLNHTSEEVQPVLNLLEEVMGENNLTQEQLIPEQLIPEHNKVSTEVNSSDNNLNTTDTMKEVQSDGIYTGKKVYLTFDDGPSIYTEEILNILAEYDAKATFFVIGKKDDYSKELYQRIVKDGHSLGMHSYSHRYEKIYNSVEDFDRDFTKLWKLLYDTTGYKPSIFRFPGGSENLVSKNSMEDFIGYLNENSIVYFDWNVDSGDATGVEYSKDQLIENILNGVKEKNTSIVLMHDSQAKKATVESLPELLEELTSGGAQILPLDKDVSPIQMIKADSIK